MKFQIALLLTFFLMACQKANKESHSTRQKSQIVIGVAQEPDTLFMPFKEMLVSEEVMRAGNYSLTVFDENWKIIPFAAKSIPTFENGGLKLVGPKEQPKMIAVWEIRDDFFWADGTPLTADDFVFYNNVIKDPNQEIIDRTAVEKIEKIEAQGPNRKTLVVTWKEPYAYYHSYRNHEALPKHLLAHEYQKNPSQFKQNAYGIQPVLAGAYSIQDWVFGSHLIAKKNPFNQSPFKAKIDQIVWKIIPQTNTLESNLVSGAIDIISPVGIDFDQALQFEKRHGKEYDFHYTPGLVWEHIDFNLENPILKDKRVRQAMAYGANRAGIVETLFQGKQTLAHGTEPPKSIYYNPKVTQYGYDPKKASELLEAAGWKLLKNEEIRQKNGQPLKLTLMSTAGNKSREKVEQLLQSDWKKIGIEVEIKNQPAKVFFGQTLRKRNYPHMAMYSWIKDPLKLSDTLLRCDYIPSKKNNYLGQNMPAFCNQKVDSLLQQASKELDTQKRIKLAHEVESILSEELPSLPLYFRTDISVTKKGIKGFKPLGILQPISWNAYDWEWVN